MCTVLLATALRITIHTLTQFTVKWANSKEVPLLPSFETRSVIRRPTTSQAAIKNSSQAGAKEFIFTQQKWSHHIQSNGVHCDISGTGGMLRKV